MNTRFTPPTTDVQYWANKTINNSGGGKTIAVPDGVKGWSWGAFLANAIWAVWNKTWIGLLTFVPIVGLCMVFYLGFNGRELAWRNRRWDSLEHFESVQRRWSFWSVTVCASWLLLNGIGVLLLLLVPGLADQLRD